MEEYTELENQTDQGFEVTIRQVEERDDDNEENHQTVDELRKRKRGADEARARNLISEKAASLMEESLKNRGFIAERGFKNIISPFAEVLERREWQLLAEHKDSGCASLVKEFYANMVENEGRRVYVRGQWVEFSIAKINILFNLSVQKNGSKFKKQLKEPEHQKRVYLLTEGEGEWRGTKINPFRSIARGDLAEEAKIWFYFISSVIRPSKYLSIVGIEEAILLYALLKGYKINVGKIIKNSILGYVESKCRGMIPHSATITSLCIQGGVKEEWGIEETYPRASPLTLTGITKGPKNRGKGKKKKQKKEK